MLNRCGWISYSGGKGTLFWGNYHFLVMNDHLWGPSVYGDKSFTKIQARVRPPPIKAMPGFWEGMVGHPIPKWDTFLKIQQQSNSLYLWSCDIYSFSFDAKSLMPLLLSGSNFIQIHWSRGVRWTLLVHCCTIFLDLKYRWSIKKSKYKWKII